MQLWMSRLHPGLFAGQTQGQNLREDHAQFVVLLWGLGEGVLETDEEPRIFYADPPVLAMVNASDQTLIGAKF
jgi:hypothetical protein